MSRPIEPETKEKLLEKCFDAVLKNGSLDLSINKLGAKVRSSGRMLIYHFESKENLDQLMAKKLDSTLRDELKEIFAKHGKENILEKFWERLTSDPKLKSLFKLLFDSAQYTEKNVSLSLTIENETVLWIRLLSEYFEDESVASTALLLLQGAMLDFLITGDGARGKKSLKTFQQLCRQK